MTRASGCLDASCTILYKLWLGMFFCAIVDALSGDRLIPRRSNRQRTRLPVGSPQYILGRSRDRQRETRKHDIIIMRISPPVLKDADSEEHTIHKREQEVSASSTFLQP